MVKKWKSGESGESGVFDSICDCVVSVVMWSHWSVYGVVLVPYVDAVLGVTVMRVLLFGLYAERVYGCDGDGNVGVGVKNV